MGISPRKTVFYNYNSVKDLPADFCDHNFILRHINNAENEALDEEQLGGIL